MGRGRPEASPGKVSTCSSPGKLPLLLRRRFLVSLPAAGCACAGRESLDFATLEQPEERRNVHYSDAFIGPSSSSCMLSTYHLPLPSCGLIPHRLGSSAVIPTNAETRSIIAHGQAVSEKDSYHLLIAAGTEISSALTGFLFTIPSIQMSALVF
ncbi:hypothetical protein UY3_04372 [Chelonia mydas]|uniref:Uncharacterized protein n=1 Tax=Chelonia mydas TaxID=8469 RepID=M7BKL7_CHEMY|nr:hypothetical protein UY3_04372 [Chelonia mydas]